VILKMLIHIGGGNMISDTRLIAVVSPVGAPIKRLIAEAKAKSLLIDATCGKKTKTVFVMDSGHIVLSSSEAETIMKKSRNGDKDE
jgi:regulator of extracellular matrix RemA (YlzA/DUF370 family)